MHTITTQTQIDADGHLHLDIPIGLDFAGQEIEIQVSVRSLHPVQPISHPSRFDLRAVQTICDEIAALPILDSLAPDEILGYNDIGLPE